MSGLEASLLLIAGALVVMLLIGAFLGGVVFLLDRLWR